MVRQTFCGIFIEVDSYRFLGSQRAISGAFLSVSVQEWFNINLCYAFGIDAEAYIQTIALLRNALMQKNGIKKQ